MSRLSRSTCPFAFALDHFGDKWSLLILRDLIFFGKKYNADFAESDEKIATNILAERLTRLKEDGFIKGSRDKENGRKIIYTPTPKALDLIPMMLEMTLWSAKHDPKTRVQKKDEDSIKRDKAAIAKRIRSELEK